MLEALGQKPPTGHEVKLERNNAQENVEDEQDKVQDMLLHSDLQQSAISRLKALCAANGIDGAAVQSAAALRR